MFGGSLALGRMVPQRATVDPKDIPPPTPVTIPRFQPFAGDDDLGSSTESLQSLLCHSGRINQQSLGQAGLSALGVDLSLDVPLAELLPDPSYAPDFAQWTQLTVEEAEKLNPSTRKPIHNGNLSPGCQVYLERRKELSHLNIDGFRTVRRIQPPKGQPHARLGNAYEFFRSLEDLTTFWDDPTQAAPELPPSPELSPEEGADDGPSPSEEQSKSSTPGSTATGEPFRVRRMASGTSMPPEYRHNVISAFIKLLAYDFGCSVTYARVEPRLQLSSPDGKVAYPRKTYLPSNCSFVCQSATTREAARAGILTGPVAVVSTRPTVDFTTPDPETSQSLDLGREVIAALITAQHRARQGKEEVRFGEGKWWTSKPRWGGGTGGPIGREVDRDGVVGDKDAKPTDSEGLPIAKKPRKNMSMYDNYRMVRPPSSTWDKKTRYEAIGKQQGADFDDIFVISSLFHHISILRVRVPSRLLEVLEGSPEPDGPGRSWGKVKAWRSEWFDLFSVDQRVEAMELVWGVMAYLMRKEPVDDVQMANA